MKINRNGGRFKQKYKLLMDEFSRFARWVLFGKFLKYVHVAKDPDACWEWRGHFDKDGYGRFWWPDWNKQINAALASYMLFRGRMSRKERRKWFACHSCDNPPCVNPRHIWLGTAKQNAEDRARKGRNNTPVGEDAGSALLTNAEVKQIKKLLVSGNYYQKEIAEQFGVNPMVISDIALGKTWKHILQ